MSREISARCCCRNALRLPSFAQYLSGVLCHGTIKNGADLLGGTRVVLQPPEDRIERRTCHRGIPHPGTFMIQVTQKFDAMEPVQPGVMQMPKENMRATSGELDPVNTKVALTMPVRVWRMPMMQPATMFAVTPESEVASAMWEIRDFVCKFS